MNETSIQYLDFTWNPIAMRCRPVSEGCENCWHLRIADRLRDNPILSPKQRDAYAGGTPVLLEEEIDAPSGLKKPSVIGVQFMGDLFEVSIWPEYRREVFWAMQRCEWHTFVVLTKRPAVMREWCEKEALGAPILPNVIGMVTAENQRRADERIPDLLACPFKMRGVSIEPMLGPVDLTNVAGNDCLSAANDGFWDWDGVQLRPAHLDWVVCGGETGPGARAMNPAWVRSLRDQCISADVPFYFKHWGGRKEAGRLIDGRHWEQMPRTTTSDIEQRI